MNKRTVQFTNTITKVIEHGDFFTLYMGAKYIPLSRQYGAVPRKGDLLTVYSLNHEFGTIRGMDLNGRRIYYLSDRQLEDQIENNYQTKNP